MIDQTANTPAYTSPYKFNGKELDDSTGMYYYGARYYDPRISVWMSVDPMAEKRSWVSPYNYCLNNPISNIDISGALDEPVFGSNGIFKGTTKEGYSGTVLIYDGKIDFSKMSKNELMTKYNATSYDSERGKLSDNSKSLIWTHIVSQLEGTNIFDEKFKMSTITHGQIQSRDINGSWGVPINETGTGSGSIFGSDKYSYETTVANIQSSLAVHEWYSHLKKGNNDRIKSHRLAYKNVINYKPLWNRTTDAYKGFVIRTLKKYTSNETGRTQVDPLYRNIYKKYYNRY